MHLNPVLKLAPLLHVRQAPADFSNYNLCAQNCLYGQLSISGCTTYGTATVAAVVQTNACLCRSTNYLRAVAKCVYSGCGAAILQNTGLVLQDNCNLSGTPSVLNAGAFVNAGYPEASNPPAPTPVEGSTSSSSVQERAPTTTTTTPIAAASETTPASSSDGGINLNINGAGGDGGNGNGGNGGTNNICVNCKNPDTPTGGVPQSDKIAIGVGLGVGLPTIIIGVWGLWCARKRKQRGKKSEEPDLESNTTVSDEERRFRTNNVEINGRTRDLPELQSVV